MDMVKFVIVGAGAVGCAIAHELTRRKENDIFLFEKSQYLADGQSGRNSGVIHAGIYYKRGSLKARLCVEGNRLMYDLCGKNGVPFARTGKLIVATDAEESARLTRLLQRALDNGAEGVRMIGRDEVRGFEPNVDAVAAIYAPSTGSVDAASYVKTLARLAENGGVQLIMRTEVVGVEPVGDHFVVEVQRADGLRERIAAEYVINSAGLYSDAVSKMIDPGWSRMLSPLRGEYYKFNRAKRENIRMNGLNVYPAPEYLMAGGERVMVVGIHLTPTFDMLAGGEIGIGDTVTVGPEFVPVTDREDHEGNRLPKEVFFEKARRYFPNLTSDDLSIDFSGIMANLGSGHDWVIERDAKHPNFIHLVGIDSPALTSSLAIARHVADMMEIQN